MGALQAQPRVEGEPLMPFNILAVLTSCYVLCCSQVREPGVLELEVDNESEAEAAELLLKSMYSTANVALPLQGSNQAMLLQVNFPCLMLLYEAVHASCVCAACASYAARQFGPGNLYSGTRGITHHCMWCSIACVPLRCCASRTG